MESLARTANRGSISTGYDIDNSCKFEHSNAESLGKDQAQGTQTTWTFSTWLKRTALSDTSHSYHHVWAAGRSDLDNGTKFYFRGDSSYPENRIFFYMDNGGTQYLHGATSQSFRDTSAWYHIVWAVDTTQSTASDRSKVYINGELQTLVGVSGAAFTNPPQNSSTRVNDNGGVMYVGAQNQNGGNRFRGYLAETVLIDGSQLDVTDFGEYDDDSGIWIPKDVSGLSFGTRGFYLDYSDASNLGNDADGSTEFNEYNITAADQATDTPTNNFATFNVAQPRQSGTTIAEGGTEMYVNSNYQTAVSSIAVSSGKWYAEFIAGGGNAMVGFVDVTEWTIPQLHNGFWLGYDGTGNTLSVGMKGSDGVIYNESNSATGATFGNADVLSVALDMDNRKAYFAVNGTWVNSGNPATAANPILWYTQRADGTPWTDVITMGITGNSNTYPRCNFGGYSSVVPSSPQSDANGYGTFEYAPPSGYYALCGKNLAEFGGTA